MRNLVQDKRTSSFLCIFQVGGEERLDPMTTTRAKDELRSLIQKRSSRQTKLLCHKSFKNFVEDRHKKRLDEKAWPDYKQSVLTFPGSFSKSHCLLAGLKPGVGSKASIRLKPVAINAFYLNSDFVILLVKKVNENQAYNFSVTLAYSTKKFCLSFV